MRGAIARVQLGLVGTRLFGGRVTVAPRRSGAGLSAAVAVCIFSATGQDPGVLPEVIGEPRGPRVDLTVTVDGATLGTLGVLIDATALVPVFLPAVGSRFRRRMAPRPPASVV